MASVSILLVATVLAQAVPGGGQGKTAEEHFLAGRSLVEQGELGEAILEFEASYALSPVAVVLYNIAVCHDELGQYTAALEHYRQYLDEAAELTDERRSGVQARIEQLVELVEQEGSAADEASQGQGTAGAASGAEEEAVEPEAAGQDAALGEAAAAGTPGEDAALEAGDGEAQPADDDGGAGAAVTGETAGEDGGGLHRGVFWAVTGVGTAAFVGAIVTGSLSLVYHDRFESKLYEQRSEWKPLKDRSDALAIATDVLLGIGAAAALAAVVASFFTDWKRGGGAEAEGATGQGRRLGVAALCSPGLAGISLKGSF